MQKNRKPKNKKARDRKIMSSRPEAGLAIATKPTEETLDSLASLSFATDSFSTPMNSNVTEGFECYLELGLSPVSLTVPFERCKAAIEKDGVFNHDFARPKIVKRCIYFLYGKNYCGSKSSEDRIQKIKELLDRENGNFERLKSFALSGAEDRPLFNEHAADRYAELCVIYEAFSRQEGAVGGFPQMPFFRFQGSACCYIASAGSFYSIKLQKDIPDKQAPNTTIDIAQFVRRNLFCTDEAIDKRVIRNSGGFAIELVEELTDRSDHDWSRLWFPIQFDARVVGELLLSDLRLKGPVGLVTHFHCSDSFKAAGNDQSKGNGYWLFDGDFECKGEFVLLPNKHNNDDCRQKYRDFCEAQRDRAESEKQACKAMVHEHLSGRTLFDESEHSGHSESSLSAFLSSSSSTSSGVEHSSGYHSMVMLSGLRTEEGKHLFMLLNWWPHMPLVVVSDEYLKACEANVYFLTFPLTEKPMFAQKESCLAECLSPDFNDGGDGENTEVIVCGSKDLYGEDYREWTPIKDDGSPVI